MAAPDGQRDPMTQSGKIGAVVYDLRASGVVRNLLRIAQRARADGIDFQIWPLRPQGEFLDQAKDVAIVDPVLSASVGIQRDFDSLFHHKPSLNARRPSCFPPVTRCTGIWPGHSEYFRQARVHIWSDAQATLSSP